MIKANLIVILGPTASGKTSLAIDIAKQVDGEIVSADSMQIYKGLPICTAQPTVEEMQSIPHHLIGYVDPLYNYSVGEYQSRAIECIDEILSRGRTPILCGGSGLYIDSVIFDMDFAKVSGDKDIRKKYTDIYDDDGAAKLYSILQELSPSVAERIHPNNINRVIRALEIQELTGKDIDEYNGNKMKKHRYNTTIYGIKWDRKALYNRIDNRVDVMLELGILDEIVRMKEYGIRPENTAYKAIGFKEFTPYLENLTSFEEAVSKLKQHSRNYAKRQMTWFKRVEAVNWIEFNQNSSICQEKTKILQILANNNF